MGKNAGKLAMAATACIVVACSLLGSHRSLAALRSGVEDTFTQGANGSGYSIAGDLQTSLDIAANLQTVAGRYLPEDDKTLAQLKSSRTVLADAKSIDQKKDAHSVLLAACEEVQQSLLACPVSDADVTYLTGFRVDLTAAAHTMRSDGYNQLARDFNHQVLGKFPANVLGRATGISPLETFD